MGMAFSCRENLEDKAYFAKDALFGGKLRK